MRGRGIEFIGIVRGPGDPVPRSVRPSLRMRWYHSAVQSSPRILAMFCLETWCRVIYRVRITVMIDVTTHIVAPMSQIAYIDAQLSDLNRYDSEFQALRKDNVVALTAVPIPRSPRDSDKRYNNVNSLTFRTFGAPVEVIFLPMVRFSITTPRCRCKRVRAVGARGQYDQQGSIRCGSVACHRLVHLP